MAADKITPIREALGEDWLSVIYEKKVRAGRTRSYKLEIPKRENQPQIQYTLLGIELKIGRKRFSCPDLATARYLRVFARLGCAEFAIPYDISRLPGLADELETSFQRTLVVMQKKNADTLRGKLIKVLREEIEAIGPGEPMPLFNRRTKQSP